MHIYGPSPDDSGEGEGHEHIPVAPGCVYCVELRMLIVNTSQLMRRWVGAITPQDRSDAAFAVADQFSQDNPTYPVRVVSYTFEGDSGYE